MLELKSVQPIFGSFEIAPPVTPPVTPPVMQTGAKQTISLERNRGVHSLPVTSGVRPLSAVIACGAPGITINDSLTPPTPATPYPYPITVSGLTGNISALTVTIGFFHHTFPDDVDMLLVAPDGTKMVIWSDVGGNHPATALIDLTDTAANLLPDSDELTSNSFRPTDFDATDLAFPAPAPAPSLADRAAPAGTATFTNHFVGMTPAQANGVWNLYVVDDENQDSGAIDLGVCLNIEQTGAPISPGSLLISEFRLRGPNGANDEYVEIYNPTASTITVDDVMGEVGYGVVASDGALRCTIPNGNKILPGGHFLCANSIGYSLDASAIANSTYLADIPDNAGIALFQTTDPAGFTLANRLDAVGSTTEANTLYKEGTGYPHLSPVSIEYAFYRDLCGLNASNVCSTSGKPRDTDDNASDFLFVSTNGMNIGAGQRLGAPGPENFFSHIQNNAGFETNLLDTTNASSAVPNRVRDFTPGSPSNSIFGTMSIRRRFVNNTGTPITRLRLRIIQITTLPATPGFADLRPITSSDVTVSSIQDSQTCSAAGQVSPCSVIVRGTTLEPPPQPNGGGFNSSMIIALPGGILLPGASIDVQILLGVQQTGNFRVLVNIEAIAL
jgi:hypothetical protein